MVLKPSSVEPVKQWPRGSSAPRPPPPPPSPAACLCATWPPPAPPASWPWQPEHLGQHGGAGSHTAAWDSDQPGGGAGDLPERLPAPSEAAAPLHPTELLARRITVHRRWLYKCMVPLLQGRGAGPPARKPLDSRAA